MLHHDKELFEQLVLLTSENLGIEAGIVEKDYYVTILLKEITEKQPDIIFKGGTSLSKCYKVINRFSEDIDLNVLGNSKPGESRKRHLKESIISSIQDLEFLLCNPDDIRSRRDFNKYIVEYPSNFGAEYIKQHLIIETAVFMCAYPIHRMRAGSLIYDYLKKNDYNDLIEKYQLEPFEINVQTAERTFIDKVFALCDYYLAGNITEHSRHIYDLYKLLQVVEINDELKALAKDVRKERQNHKACLSAADDIDLNDILQKIVDNDIYKTDYNSITSALLFDEVGYDEAITVIIKIIEEKLFD